MGDCVYNVLCVLIIANLKLNNNNNAQLICISPNTFFSYCNLLLNWGRTFLILFLACCLPCILLFLFYVFQVN